MRRAVVGLVAALPLFVGAALAAGALGAGPAVVGPDFFEYRAAAEVLAGGGNPYDAERLLELQRPQGLTDRNSPPDAPRATMMWNPPWVAPLILPFGPLPWRGGYLAWCALQTWLVAASALLLWGVYGADSGTGPRGYRAALAVAAVFPPTVWVVTAGQISGYLLFGLAGFAAGMRAGRPGLAGAALALTAVKPHLFLPLVAALGCSATRDRPARKAVLAGGAVIALAALSPLPLRPGIWADYLAATAAPTDEFHYAPEDWISPIPAGWLRRELDLPLAWQFVPSYVAALGLAGYWFAERREWDWPRELPAAVLASVVTTGYGAWVFDLVVLLVPLTHAAGVLARSGSGRAQLSGAAALLAFAALALGRVLPVELWSTAVAAGWAAVAAFGRRGGG